MTDSPDGKPSFCAGGAMLIFVDCEARGLSPVSGTLTEFGCVAYPSMETFHGRLFESSPDPDNPAIPTIGKHLNSSAVVAHQLVTWLGRVCNGERAVMVSDNPAFDFMWIAGMFDQAGMDNPFGHSARRISDFYAGVKRNWKNTQGWKKYRVTPHDHNPVHDALGNAEAYTKIMGMLDD